MTDLKCGALIVGCLLATLSTACTGGSGSDGGSDAASDSPFVPMYQPASCAQPNQAPIRMADGTSNCTVVGADQTAATGMWPGTTGATAPIVYVQPGATGGDGSMAHPYGDIASALGATPPPHTVVLSSGTHTLSAPIALTSDVSLVGTGTAAGAMGTTLAAPAAMSTVLISGMGTHVSLSSLAIQYPANGCGMTGGAIDATGGTVTLDNVDIEGPYNGVHATQTTLHATRLTVRHACNWGVFLSSGSDGTLQSVLVRDGTGAGIIVQDSHIDLQTALIASNGRDGIALLGGNGTAHHLAGVVSTGNAVTAMRVEHSASGSAAQLTGSRLSLSGTRALAGVPGADGLYVGTGGTVTLDTDIVGDANRGHGSEIVGNGRVGVLVGADTAADGGGPMGTPGQFEMNGALVASNLQAGLFAQQSATLTALRYNRFTDNVALGVGLSSGATVRILACNEHSHTHMGGFATSLGTFAIGDGLSISEPSAGTASTVMGNEFDSNDRFGMLLSGATATLTANTGTGNRYGIGAYDLSAMIDASNTVTGASPMPMLMGLDVARGAMAH